MDESPATSTPGEPEGPRRAPSFGLGYLGGALAASTRTFRDLAAAPRGSWIGPMAVAAILTTAAAWIMLPEILDVSYTSALAMMEKMGVPEAQMEEALAKIPLEPTTPVLLQNVFSNLLLTPLVMLIGAAFVHLVCRLFGGQSKFGATLGMFSVAYVVWALGGLVRSAVVAASDTMEVTLGPGALLPNVDYLSPLGIVLDLFDVFSIWHLVVLVTGISVVTRVPRGTGWTVGLAFWMVRSLFVAGGKAFMLWSQGG